MKLFLLVLLALPGIASAQSVVVDSFVQVSPADPYLGEVCGHVVDVPGDVINLKVQADYNSTRPGDYHTETSYNGNFCQVVRTLYGTVEVSLLNSNPTVGTTQLIQKSSKR